ncbi:MAG: ATP-binding cassette domain-containing protein, partial [Thermoprotei archaeon]
MQIGGATIVRGLSFQVERGEVAALFGPNGAGKTTTLRAVVGLYRHGGRVLLGGEDVSHLSPQERARLGLGYSPEDGGLFPSLTVYENLLLPVKTLKLDEGRMREVLEVVPVVKGLLDRKAYALS